MFVATNDKVIGSLMWPDHGSYLPLLARKRTVRASGECMWLSILSQGDSQNYYPLDYGGFTWEIYVGCNNI